MPVPTDPVLIILIALVLWGFWAACVLRDHKTAGREAPRRDLMPSLAIGPRRPPYCGLCGGSHDYDECPLDREDS